RPTDSFPLPAARAGCRRTAFSGSPEPVAVLMPAASAATATTQHFREEEERGNTHPGISSAAPAPVVHGAVAQLRLPQALGIAHDRPLRRADHVPGTPAHRGAGAERVPL